MERSRAAPKDMVVGWVDLVGKQHQTTPLKRAGAHDKLGVSLTSQTKTPTSSLSTSPDIHRLVLFPSRCCEFDTGVESR